MASRSEPEWLIYVVAAAIVMPALVPVGFRLMGNPEAALASLLVVCAAAPLQAVMAGLLLMMRIR